MPAEMRRTQVDLFARAQSSVFWLAAFLLSTVPLTIATNVYRSYSLPRFALLLSGASILLPLLILILSSARRYWALLKSWHVGLISLYLLAVATSSFFGAAPYVSILGSFEIQMGLVTHVCCFVCFLALVIGIADNPTRFRRALWAMALPGLLIALYAVAQSAAFDPLVPPRLYTFSAGGESIIRAVGTLGHPDFLGNFLLYTTPLSAGLAFASGGRSRRIALAGTVFSVAAIVLSGTRGAWVGLGLGAVVFAALQIKSGRVAAPRAIATGRSAPTSGSSKPIRGFLPASIILVILVAALSFSPASHGIAARAKSFVSERLTGAGRTLLWRDSLGMIRAYSLLGCGAEAFRKSFLPYKSPELVRMTGKIQNESSHNSYIDAAVSFGIPGAVFYVALIVSTLGLVLRARVRVTGEQSILLTGIASSFVAAIVHKVFIFDQISTGLYFFAFAGLALSSSNLVRSRVGSPIGHDDKSRSHFGPAVAVTLALGVALVGAAIWYSASLLNADLEIRRALESATTADYEGLLEHGKRAADAHDPSGGYDFLFARALTDCAEKIQSAAGDGSLAKLSRKSAIDMAITHAERSTRHGISSDSSYVLLCYLASEKEDYAALQAYAKEAIKWDTLYAPSHSFLAEADLAAGDIDGAKREISIWLGLIGRGTGDAGRGKRIQEFIDGCSAIAEKGNYLRARVELIKGSVAAADDCSECHIALAAAYEKYGFLDDAIQEWRRLIENDAARADSEGAQSRVALLMQKLPTGTTRRQSGRQ